MGGVGAYFFRTASGILSALLFFGCAVTETIGFIKEMEDTGSDSTTGSRATTSDAPPESDSDSTSVGRDSASDSASGEGTEGDGTDTGEDTASGGDTGSGRTDSESGTDTAPMDTASETTPPVDTESGTDTAVDGDSETGDDTDSQTDREDSDSSSDTVSAPCPYPTMFVSGRYLYDTCGARVVPIGVNEMMVWNSADRTGADLFPEIKKTGANTVRFSWSTGSSDSTVTPSFSELDDVIANCIDQRMVAFPEIHDFDRADFSLVSDIVDWWTSPEVVEIVSRHQQHLIITIANGAGDDTVTSSQFLETYTEAVARMRDAGIDVPIVIEAAGAGSNIALLYETFEALIASDPLGNLMFSLHIWWAAADGSTSRIIDTFAQAAALELPLIISEFAPFNGNCEQYIDYETIMAECGRHGFGFFPWTWGGVTDGDCIYLGMTDDGQFGNWRDTPVDEWGERVAVSSPSSIGALSVEVSSFAHR